MQKYFKYLFVCVIIIFLGVALYLTPTSNPSNKLFVETRNATYNKKDYYPTLSKGATDKAIENKVYAGIVSHHQLVEPLISNFYLKLQKQKVKTIIILGPAHFYSGSGSAFVTKKNYQTPWGILELDKNINNQLIQSGVVQVAEQAFEGEHSIGLQVGYIKAIFPQAKIVPIILKRGQKINNLVPLSEQINKLDKDELLVLASVDFSHGVNNLTAKSQDNQSLKYLQSLNFENINKIYADSPESLYILLRFAKNAEAERFDYKNTNAAIFSNSPELNDVTSYFFGFYTKN